MLFCVYTLLFLSFFFFSFSPPSHHLLKSKRTRVISIHPPYHISRPPSRIKITPVVLRPNPTHSRQVNKVRTETKRKDNTGEEEEPRHTVCKIHLHTC
ncbi:hypothetical protein V8C37DRAFT_213265 [Trichoderma ceciliae]